MIEMGVIFERKIVSIVTITLLGIRFSFWGRALESAFYEALQQIHLMHAPVCEPLPGELCGGGGGQAGQSLRTLARTSAAHRPGSPGLLGCGFSGQKHISNTHNLEYTSLCNPTGWPFLN